MSSVRVNSRYWTRAPEFEHFLATADLSRFSGLRDKPLAETRLMMERLDVQTTPPMPSVKSEDLVIHARDGKAIQLRIWRHEDRTAADSSSPLAIIFHGGGWIYGGLNTEPGLVSTFVEVFKYIAVSVDYRMAPEHPFPGSFNDAYDTLTWIQENAKSLGGNPSKIFISGCSAGANLAAAVTLEAKARNRLDGVMGQILVVPPTCHYRHHSYSRHPLESFREFSSAPLLSTEMMQEMWDAYYPNYEPNPRVSPLLASDHSGLPPACADPLCDEGIAYSNCLEDALVPVKLDIFPGLPHGSQTALLGMPEKDKYLKGLQTGIFWIQNTSEAIVRE